MTRVAVVLFNLGGPDGLEAVEPFLRNLFYDPAIVRLPAPLRWILARLIARRRGPVARDIYRQIGGASPIRANTEAQATALQEILGANFRVFVAMRHWHPFSAETAAAVKAWSPDRILLLPLYPQFSTTTTWSSYQAWKKAVDVIGLAVPTRLLCCYPNDIGFAAAVAGPLRRALDEMPPSTRVLFSAHGLPKKIVNAGDPYPWQVQRSVSAVRTILDRDCETVICYQSRVGPLQWLEPSIDAEIRRAGAARRPVIVVPIAFVSEHSETLVELDRDYRRLAGEVGVPSYRRLATVGTAPLFIAGLAQLVREMLGQSPGTGTADGKRLCPSDYRDCPYSTGTYG